MLDPKPAADPLPMKPLRLWLLVLLALLLPVRGALAGVMACPPPGAALQAQAPATDGHAAHHHHPVDADADAAAPDPSQAHHGDTGHHGSDASSSSEPDRCNLCAAICSITPMAGGTPAIFAPHDPAATNFAAFTVPAPSR